MTIESVSAGQLIDPDWGNAVADQLNDLPLKIQAGQVTVPAFTDGAGNATVVFPEPFGAEPIFVCNLVSSGGTYVATATSGSATDYPVAVFRTDGGATGVERIVNWIAVGTPA